MPSASATGGRHRKSKPMSRAVKRALVVAAVTPVAGAVLAGPSAFAADKSVSKAGAADAIPDASGGLDPAEQKIKDNLDARAQNESLGTTFSGVVLDADSDKVIWGHDADTALMPASNTKLATAITALTTLGGDHTFSTKVVYGDGTLTLVGGGDRTLTTADLKELAKNAVAGLKNAGLDSVKVRIDDSLFADPTLAEGWNDSYYDDQISPVRSLVVDGGNFSADTSMDAGKVFAKQLADQGVTVDGDVTRGEADDAQFVTEHKSAPLSDIVKKMLKTSDNDIAETLLRMSALAYEDAIAPEGSAPAKGATFEDGTKLARFVLENVFHVSMENFEIHDGSGLSRANRIPARTVADMLDLLTDSRYQQLLKPIDEGLPVAGEEGSTLGPEWGRFDTPDSECAVGKVKAKTGTLTGAVALSGLTKGQDGSWKVFSFIDNNASTDADSGAIKDTLDGLAATVNGCWA